MDHCHGWVVFNFYMTKRKAESSPEVVIASEIACSEAAAATEIAQYNLTVEAPSSTEPTYMQVNIQLTKRTQQLLRGLAPKTGQP